MTGSGRPVTMTAHHRVDQHARLAHAMRHAVLRQLDRRGWPWDARLSLLLDQLDEALRAREEVR
jgi:hypothetical protein